MAWSSKNVNWWVKAGDKWEGPYYGGKALLINGVGVTLKDYTAKVSTWPSATGKQLSGDGSSSHNVLSKLDNAMGAKRGARITTHFKGPGEPFPNIWVHCMQKRYTFMYKPAPPVLAHITHNPTIPNIVFLSEPEDTIVYRV